MRSPLTQMTPESGLSKAQNQLQNRRFTRAAGAKDDLRMSGEQCEADVAEHHLLVEGERHLVEDHNRRTGA